MGKHGDGEIAGGLTGRERGSEGDEVVLPPRIMEDLLNEGLCDVDMFRDHCELLLLCERGSPLLTPRGQDMAISLKKALLDRYIEELQLARLPIITITATVKFSCRLDIVTLFPLLRASEDFKVSYGYTTRDGKKFSSLEDHSKKLFGNIIRLEVCHGGRIYYPKLFCSLIHITGARSMEQINAIANIIFARIAEVQQNLAAVAVGRGDGFLERQAREFNEEHLGWLRSLGEVVPPDLALEEPRIIMIKRNTNLGFPVHRQYFHQMFLDVPRFYPHYEKTIDNDLSINVQLVPGKIKPRVSFTLCANGSLSIYSANEKSYCEETAKLFIYCREFHRRVSIRRIDMAVDLIHDLSFPARLCKVGQTGAVRVWEVDHLDQDGEYYVVMRYGQKDGKMQESRVRVVTNKSGRNPWQQMILECNSRIKKKLDEGYQVAENFHAGVQPRLPRGKCQLAVKWRDVKKKVYPVWLQAKCDGVRGLAYLQDDEVILVSRKGLPWPHLAHLREQLLPILRELPEDCGLDGELFVKDVPLQTLNSWIRSSKEMHPQNGRVCYYIFDLITRNPLSLDERAGLLRRAAPAIPLLRWWEPHQTPPDGSLAMLEWLQAADEAEIAQIHDVCVDEGGFEGVVIRFPRQHGALSHYRFDRNKNLAKYTTFEEDEGVVIEVLDGRGKDEGLAIFRLQYGKFVVDCRPKADAATRRGWFLDAASCLGRKYTFKFRGRSIDGQPMYPIGKAFRDDI